jgi:hypothetical protein
VTQITSNAVSRFGGLVVESWRIECCCLCCVPLKTLELTSRACRAEAGCRAGLEPQGPAPRCLKSGDLLSQVQQPGSIT